MRKRSATALSGSIYRRDKSPTFTGPEVVPYASRQPNIQYRQNGTYSCVTHALGDHQTQPPYPANVVNFVQTRAPIIEHDHRHAGHHLRLAKTREVYCQRKVTGEEIMATKAEIRASAKSLCFQACTDCTSADECDPDENWIEEARAALETNEIKSKSK